MMFNRDKLKELSDIIRAEGKNLAQVNDDLSKDLFQRAGRIWYTYFSQAIVCLSHGGVAESFFSMNNFYEHPDLQTFNYYRAENNSVQISQDAVKKFLIEDKAIEIDTALDELDVSLCLGSHEGMLRLARCLYTANLNEEMILATASYGLIAGYLATMEPVSYKLRFVAIDRENGEKVDIEHLESTLLKYPKAKTLYLELKTTAGYVYTNEEILRVIELCKKYNMFFIADATHINMNYHIKDKFADVVGLCQKHNFHDFVSIYTGSKTYGLERARIGFMVMSKRMAKSSFEVINNELNTVIGNCFDLPFVVGSALINSPVESRLKYHSDAALRHRFNMNLMLAYIEGIQSLAIDQDSKEQIVDEIENKYKNGIKGLKAIFKPKCGTHMIIETSDLKNKFLTNIRIFNAEMFCYVLNKIAGVVTLHSYCIMDPNGYSMRLSFAIKADVHKGMMAIHDLVEALTDYPTPNEFLQEVPLAENLIFENSTFGKVSASPLLTGSFFSDAAQAPSMNFKCETDSVTPIDQINLTPGRSL